MDAVGSLPADDDPVGSEDEVDASGVLVLGLGGADAVLEVLDDIAKPRSSRRQAAAA